jgi:hypothetical protein
MGELEQSMAQEGWWKGGSEQRGGREETSERTKYLIVRQASLHGYLLFRHLNLVVLGKRPVHSVEPCKRVREHVMEKKDGRVEGKRAREEKV